MSTEVRTGRWRRRVGAALAVLALAGTTAAVSPGGGDGQLTAQEASQEDRSTATVATPQPTTDGAPTTIILGSAVAAPISAERGSPVAVVMAVGLFAAMAGVSSRPRS